MFTFLQYFNRTKGSFACISILVIASLLTQFRDVRADSGMKSSIERHQDPITVLPADGQIIYRHGNGGKKHLYIIGISHRDTLTRSNGLNTARVQSEVYRIGERLINNKDIELILPEGYFTNPVKEEEALQRTKNNKKHGSGMRSISIDMSALEEKLRTDIHTNAEKLLFENHNVMIGQVENDRLYKDIVARIGKIDRNGNTFESIFEKLQLDYLQERRTAAILQGIPEIIDIQIRDGKISRGNAMLTIGVSHLSQIISSIEQNKLIVRSPAFTPFSDYISEVNLVNEGFDITIIIPRTIADDDGLLGLTKLASYAGQLP